MIESEEMSNAYNILLVHALSNETIRAKTLKRRQHGLRLCDGVGVPLTADGEHN